MQAAVRDRYGGPEVVRLRDVATPTPADDGVLVRVRACGVNPYDVHVSLAGRPYVARMGAGLRRPKDPGLGVDFSGTVEAVGRDVEHLEPGDDVFGFGQASFAEYVHATRAVARKPLNLSFEEAAAAPTAGATALQALRDKGQVREGQRVLVNGASGGVGTFAVQIAKTAGAHVTGVCSGANIDLVRSLGADRVVDYQREDFTSTGQRYDLLIDVAGNRRWSALHRVLADDGVCVLVGGPKDNRWLGPLSRWARTQVAALPARQRVAVLLAQMRREDLDALRTMFEAGALRSLVDRTYRLEDAAEALAHVGAGHARAKIVVTIP
jgi:NADPH:quinone reductase-like Zn-dependent oxidoreductase